MTLKLVIGLKDGKSVQKEIDDAAAKSVLGKKLGDVLKGETLGFAGYEFEIRGGSDHCGFPMKRDVSGFLRKKLLYVEGVGLKKTAQGIRHRKTVCGQVVSPKITQLNVKVVKEGKDSLEPKSEAPEGGAEAPKEVAPEAKVEGKKHEAKVEAPKEEKAKPPEAGKEKAETPPKAEDKSSEAKEAPKSEPAK